jgi:hypothetical protein
MKIRILRQTMLGGTVARVGDVLEASLPDSQYLIGINKAERVIEEPPKKEETIVEPEAPACCPPVKPTSKRRKTNASQSGL